MTDSVKHNKDNVRRYFIEVLQNQNVALIPELLADNYTFDGKPADVAGNTAFVKILHDQYGDFKYEIFDLIGEHEHVCIRWRLNAPASAKSGAGFIDGANFITGKDGKALTNWQVSTEFKTA